MLRDHSYNKAQLRARREAVLAGRHKDKESSDRLNVNIAHTREMTLWDAARVGATAASAALVLVLTFGGDRPQPVQKPALVPAATTVVGAPRMVDAHFPTLYDLAVDQCGTADADRAVDLSMTANGLTDATIGKLPIGAYIQVVCE